MDVAIHAIKKFTSRERLRVVRIFYGINDNIDTTDLIISYKLFIKFYKARYFYLSTEKKNN